jgi:aerobic carbon-monoxide dehydrogenase medium subunit
MSRMIPAWFAPTSLAEALELRAHYADDAKVVAGGTFIGILLSQRIIMPSTLLSLRNIHELTFIEKQSNSGQSNHREGSSGSLRIGAMTTHRTVERSNVVREGWPIVAYTFSLVASPRVRNQATVGGVLADADYASDPPSLLNALNASVVARNQQGEREIPVEELITGYYETSLQPDELLTEVRVPANVERAVYRKFRSRSNEDRPCVAVAATRSAGQLRVVVGAVAERPQYFPDICAIANGESITRELATEIGRRYAETIDTLSDSRGSAAYRRRVIAVEIRRALEDLIQERSA